MKIILLRAGTVALSAIYAVLKLFPTDNRKVLFLSRQANEPSLDFMMLQEELLKGGRHIRIVCICNRIEDTFSSRISYARDLLRSLYHLATARVCILDSYWPAVSILRHKRCLTVVQIWHALGKIKQSGLQAVGKTGGRPIDVAQAMRMHENYDYIVAGAKIWNSCYCGSFGCTEEKLINIGLPRLDYLVSSKEKVAAEIFRAYPELVGRTVVLYAPTFRRANKKDHSEFGEAIESRGYALVVKGHPNQEISFRSALRCPEFTAMQMLFVADVLITDYSAIALEAAAIGVRTLYYLYDYEEYTETSGLNIDIEAVMPGCVFYTLPSLMDGLVNAVEGMYPTEVLELYRDTYLIPDMGHATQDLAEFVFDHMGSDGAFDIESHV